VATLTKAITLLLLGVAALAVLAVAIAVGTVIGLVLLALA
jgi:hypothetical protein